VSTSLGYVREVLCALEQVSEVVLSGALAIEHVTKLECQLELGLHRVRTGGRCRERSLPSFLVLRVRRAIDEEAEEGQLGHRASTVPGVHPDESLRGALTLARRRTSGRPIARKSSRCRSPVRPPPHGRRMRLAWQVLRREFAGSGECCEAPELGTNVGPHVMVGGPRRARISRCSLCLQSADVQKRLS
jgi:hypothetical protein